MCKPWEISNRMQCVSCFYHLATKKICINKYFIRLSYICLRGMPKPKTIHDN